MSTGPLTGARAKTVAEKVQGAIKIRGNLYFRYIATQYTCALIGSGGMGIEHGYKAMASKVEEYRAGAARCEEQAKKERDPGEREWQMCLARAYRLLARVETERRKVAPLTEVRSIKVAA